jgi:hypothetical protein
LKKRGEPAFISFTGSTQNDAKISETLGFFLWLACEAVYGVSAIPDDHDTYLGDPLS